MANPPVSVPSPRRDDALLARLLSEVNRCRARLRSARGLSVGPRSEEHRERCQDLCSAMEAYADAASTMGVPLPYRFRDELRLHRSMAVDRRR